jgi:hypothetical protein
MTEEIMDKIEEAIDDAIDDWLENIDFIAEEGTTFLKRIGLEHNINASLSYSTGLLNTTAGSFIHFHYNREMNEEEEEDVMIEQIKSRIPELKVKLAEFFGETKH